MALRTTIRKQGDVVTERTTDSGSEFRVSTTHFINPQTGVCSTYNELRQPPRGNIYPKIMHVLGKEAKGDGCDGIFYWDDISIDVDNDDTIIAVINKVVGRYIKQSKMESSNSIEDTYCLDINVDMPSCSIIRTLPCDIVLSNVKLVILSPFDDANSTLQFGTRDKGFIFLSTCDSKLSQSDQYHHDLTAQVLKNDELILNFNRSNATTGRGNLFYSLSL
jgi:hypothetical protein